ncbi:hypothetical protein [uncultured Oscillibacter sp.]|uniref:hypothetical protein n=1 Tax=uncultured Oscillibacter sp. TaxID=876091 RepID=UPI0025EC6F06|nr:hypothetical protein [uncultured Oscillibacter sp.]
MRSKTSFFNPTLFKKDLTRFWPLWGGASALGALAPLYLLMCLIDEGFRSYAGQGLEVTQLYYAALAYGVPVISLIYAALCALAVWGWLYNPRSVGLYHSLPITRKGLFTTSFLSGMAMMLIPYAVVGGLLVVISLASGTFEPVGVLVTTLGVLGETLFYFAAATAVVFVTGNPFAFAAFYFIFQFLGFFAEWLITMLMNMFYFGVDETYRGAASFLSPTIHLVDHVGVQGQYEQIVTADGWIENGDLLWVKLTNGWLIAVYALVGVVLLGCAWALYRRRRSECAGDVVAVGWMKPIFRYGVALCAAVSGGALLYALICADLFQEGQCADPVPMAVCMAIAGIVGYYIASMLLAKSLRVFQGSRRGVLGTAVAAAAICCVIAADPFGVEGWVPSAGELESLTVNFHGSYGRGAGATVSDPGVMLKVLDAAILVTERADDLDRDRETDDEAYITFNLTYRYPEGRPVYRYYRFPAAANEGITQMLARLASDPDIQEANIFDTVTPGEDVNIAASRLTGAHLSGLYGPGAEGPADLDLTLQQAQALEEAVRRDIQAGHFGKTLFLPTYEEYASAACTGELQLYYHLTLRQSDRHGENYTHSDWVSIGLSTYCTETIQALEDLGILGLDRRLLTEAERDAMDAGRIPYTYEDPYIGYRKEGLLPADAVSPASSAVHPEYSY